jgi:glycosyltransferase involved in cell wall biosynthesis
MRVAWFSPLPPARSGIATVNAALLAVLRARLAIDCFVDLRAHARPAGSTDRHEFDAHDFVWKMRRAPYDLVVYQLGNASWHDYMWAYLARYPGLVVLHDPRLHHARARQLLQQGRADDYRAEFWYDHPAAVRDFVEYAVAGLGGPVYYSWSMLRVAVRTARMIAVHNPRVAADLREEFPGARVEAIRLGTAPPTSTAGARDRVRASFGISAQAIVFAAFGKITVEKRIAPMLQALGSIQRDGVDAHLLLVGDASEYPGLQREISESGAKTRIHVTGYVEETAIGDYLAAADACLCLRWPTALETSASWLQCLAAERPTVITDLAHLVDIPTEITLRVDLLDEAASLAAAMRALAADARLRDSIGRAGRAYWLAHHTVDAMAEDYRRIMPIAAQLPSPIVGDLPSHFADDCGARARSIANAFELSVDVLRAGETGQPA